MSSAVKKGALPKRMPPKLEQRDKRPLPPGALLRLQQISRGKSPTANFRWQLYFAGRVYHDTNHGSDSDWGSPFRDDLAPEPTQFLATEIVVSVEEWLRQEDFLNEPPYQIDEGVRGGDTFVVTARLDEQLHEVIYAAVYPPLIDNLWSLIYSA